MTISVSVPLVPSVNAMIPWMSNDVKSEVTMGGMWRMLVVSGGCCSILFNTGRMLVKVGGFGCISMGYSGICGKVCVIVSLGRGIVVIFVV